MKKLFSFTPIGRQVIAHIWYDDDVERYGIIFGSQDLDNLPACEYKTLSGLLRSRGL